MTDKQIQLSEREETKKLFESMISRLEELIHKYKELLKHL